MASLKLEGIFVPNVTPFDRDGEIEREALMGLIEFWVGAGVSGLVVNASTGEGPMLSREEKAGLIELVRERLDGRAMVIAGTGTISTRETIVLTRDARDLGAKAVLVTTPFFYRPSDEELFQHYASLVASVDIPVILYNVPKFTGYSISPRVVERIAGECSGLVGIKDSSNNPGTIAEIVRLVGDKISVLAGAADVALPTLSMGGDGAILAVANAIPETCVALYRAAKRGNLEEAGRLQLRVSHVNNVLVREHSQVAAVKLALNLMEQPAGVTRKPLMPLPEGEELEVREALKAMGLL